MRDEELMTLYLRTDQHGSGLGQDLLDAAVGDRPASLRLAAESLRARRSYERNGVLPDDARLRNGSGEGLAEICLVR